MHLNYVMLCELIGRGQLVNFELTHALEKTRPRTGV